jgi:hypothetical protein
MKNENDVKFLAGVDTAAAATGVGRAADSGSGGKKEPLERLPICRDLANERASAITSWTPKRFELEI